MAGERRRGRPKQYLEERVTTAIRVPISLHARLQEEAELRDTSINHLVVRAARYYLDHRLPPLDRDGSASDHAEVPSSSASSAR